MATNILGIGIANAIGFRRKNSGGGHISYHGLIAAWSAKGKTNEDVDRNILKDLTGNGHDIVLHNFSYGGMSGYGGYKNNLLRCRKDPQTENKIYDITAYKIIVKSWGGKDSVIYYFAEDIDMKLSACKFKLSNITGIASVRFEYSTNGIYKNDTVTKDGIYELKDANYETDFFNIRIDSVFTNKNVIIELLPEYPDALVFDGVDDYGVNESIKDVLDGCEEYTVIAKRKYIDLTKNHMPVFSITNIDSTINTLFLFEFYDGAYKTFNKASFTSNLNFPDVISWQTSNSYNQQLINKGFNTTVTGFVIGRYGRAIQYVTVALYSYYIFNRTLPDQEIKSFIRKHIDPEYLLPSEIPNPDVYYDFTNGDNSKGEANNIIKDLSGNGNDATAHNFAWNEESGYAGGGLEV